MNSIKILDKNGNYNNWTIDYDMDYYYELIKMRLKNPFYKIFCITLLTFLLTLSNRSYFASGENSKLRIVQDTTIVNVCLTFAGDVMQHMPQINSAYDY